MKVQMKVGDRVRGLPGGAIFLANEREVSAVSDDEAFVNILSNKDDSGWWPAKCFEVVTPAEPEPPKYAEVEVIGPSDAERFLLRPGEKFVLHYDVTPVETT